MSSGKQIGVTIFAAWLIINCQLACHLTRTSQDVVSRTKTGKPLDYRFLIPRQYVTFSPDRKTLAASVLENSVLHLHLWSVEAGKEVFDFPMDDKGDYVFAGDHRTIAVKVKDEVRLLNSDGSLVSSFPLKTTSGDVTYSLVASTAETFVLSLPYYYSPPHHARLLRLSDLSMVQDGLGQEKDQRGRSTI